MLEFLKALVIGVIILFAVFMGVVHFPVFTAYMILIIIGSVSAVTIIWGVGWLFLESYEGIKQWVITSRK